MTLLRSHFLLLPVSASFALLALAVPGCGGSTDNGPTDGGSPESRPPPGPGIDGGSSDAAQGPESDSGTVVLDSGVSCPAPGPDAGFYPFQTPASGIIGGNDVSCSFCNARANVFVQSYATYPTMTWLELSNGDFTFTNPASASDGYVSGVVQIASAAPGTYTSSDPTNCGNLSLSFVLPVPPGVDCGDGSITGPTCPAGCSSACSGFGCSPCTANAPEGFYGAQGGGDCFDTGEPAVGSWTITLTSVEPYTGDAGQSQGRLLYVAHGTVTAQLVGGDDPDAGSEPATLQLTF